MLRKMIVGLLVIVLVFSCYGCGESGAQQVIPEDIFAEELATDELLLYSWNSSAVALQDFSAKLPSYIQSFSKKYPDVAVTVKTFDPTEYADMLTVELLAGKGPDLIFWQNTVDEFLPDVNKTIQANAFLDLNPFFAQDPDFDFADYSPAIDAGLLNEKRYYVPISYLVDVFFSTEDSLNYHEFDWSVLETYESMSEWFTDFSESPEKYRSIVGTSLWIDSYLFSSGVCLVDYDNQIVLPDREGLRLVTELCKSLYPYFTYYENTYETPFFQTWNEERTTLVYPKFQETWELMQNNWHLFAICAPPRYGIDNDVCIAMPSVTTEKAVAIPEVSVAIRNGSFNTQNAYYFIKHLLSPVVQMDIQYSCPVLLEQLQNKTHHIFGDTTKEQLWYDMYTNVVPYRQFSPKLWELYVQYMTPYWEGNASYEQCVSELESMLELYMYE